MAEYYAIKKQTLVNIADAIRERHEVDESYTVAPENMPSEIRDIPRHEYAEVKIETSTISDLTIGYVDASGLHMADYHQYMASAGITVIKPSIMYIKDIPPTTGITVRDSGDGNITLVDRYGAWAGTSDLESGVALLYVEGDGKVIIDAAT